jgi:SAM-dependent methyltransferase
MADERNGLSAYEDRYFSLYAGRKPEFYRDALGDVIRKGRPGSILDLGCGLGLFVELALQWGLEVSGLDGSEAAIRLALERCPGLKVNVHDLSDPLPFSAGSIDNVVLFQVIAHIRPDVRKRLFSEVRRVLCTGGMVFIYSPSPRNERVRESDPTITHPMSPSELRNALSHAGFRVLSEQNEGPYTRFHLLGRIMNGITNRFGGDWLSRTANAIAIAIK